MLNNGESYPFMDYFSKIAKFYDFIIPPFKEKKLLQFITFNSAETLVEVGGGTGRAAKPLLPFVKEIILVDLSFDMLKQAKKNIHLKYLLTGSGTTLTFRNNSLELIFINDTLHHISSQQEVIESCFHALKDEGMIIIREIEPRYFWSKLIVLMEKILRFNSKFLTPTELMELCSKANLTSTYYKESKGTYIIVAKK